jgi:heat shock protein HslJ
MMKSWVKQGVGVMLLFGLLFSSFGAAHAQEGSAGLPPEMLGREWQLIVIERAGQDMVDTRGKGITLTFNRDGTAGGNSTCNLYSAPFEAPGGAALRFGDVISTLRACVDQSLMDLEALYYGLLKQVDSYSLNGDTLELNLSGGGVLRYTSDGVGNNVPGMPRTGGGTELMPFFVALTVVWLVAAGFVAARVRQAR